MNIILLFSIELREKEKRLKEIFNRVLEKKFHEYVNKFIKKLMYPRLLMVLWECLLLKKRGKAPSLSRKDILDLQT